MAIDPDVLKKQRRFFLGDSTPNNRTRRKRFRRCSFPGCMGIHKAKGFCVTHYYNKLLGYRIRPIRGSMRRASEALIERARQRLAERGIAV